jgi:hypothetical protein
MWLQFQYPLLQEQLLSILFSPAGPSVSMLSTESSDTSSDEVTPNKIFEERVVQYETAEKNSAARKQVPSVHTEAVNIEETRKKQ